MSRHDTTPADVEVYDQYPVDDPGIEPHVERYTDASEAAGNRSYRKIVTMFGLVPILAIAFVVIYFAVPRHWSVSIFGNEFQGQTLLLGIGAVTWAREIMSDVEISEERHPASSDAETRDAALTAVNAGITESRVGRRKLILGSLGGALGIVAVPAVVMLADMGPWPTNAVRRETIEKTIWAEGVRIVNDVNYLPLRPADLEIGQLVNAEPANLPDLHGAEFQVEKAKAALVVVRMDPNTIKIPDSRRDWQVGGILAYSKICTHVGCPISRWGRQRHTLRAPSARARLTLGDSGVVVFGPAARSLPQLPITTDAEGYLIAKSDFTVPVGPSYFERDSRHDYKEGDR